MLGATGMIDCNGKSIPTNVLVPFGSYDNVKPPKIEWKYASVVGFILYLADNYRPDISFSVHQCDIFMYDMGESHEEVVLGIFMCIKGTKRSVTIFHPNKDLGVDLYFYADFYSL